MKSVSMVLLIASIFLVIMGIFLIAVSRSSKEVQIRKSAINGVGNICLGSVGIILAVVYQITTMDREVAIGIFFGAAIIINVLQWVFKRASKK